MSDGFMSLPFTSYVGCRVEKVGGDYYFRGNLVAVFQKRSGQWRAVVENDDGIVHIFNFMQLRLVGTDLESLSVGDEVP